MGLATTWVLVSLALGAAVDESEWTFDEESLEESDAVDRQAGDTDALVDDESADESAGEGAMAAEPALDAGDDAAEPPWLDEIQDDGSEDDAFAQGDDARETSSESAPVSPAPLSATVAPPTPSRAPALEPALHERGGALGWGLVVGLKGGAGRAQANAGGLGWSLAVELELGYTLPLPAPLGRDLELFVAAAYAAPSLAGEGARDARLPGDGSWRYRLTLHQGIATLGALYRIPTPLSWLRPYAAAGARAYGTLTVVEGAAGIQPLRPSMETGLDLGAYGGAGIDFTVGPGAVLTEVQAALALVDGRVLRSSQGGLSLVVGYRLLL